jgi:DNA-binding NtrC family response regulator
VTASEAQSSSVNAAELGSLDEMEKRHIKQVLAATQGHKARTAEILGVSRPRLNRLLEKYGLGEDET